MNRRRRLNRTLIKEPALYQDSMCLPSTGECVRTFTLIEVARCARNNRVVHGSQLGANLGSNLGPNLASDLAKLPGQVGHSTVNHLGYIYNFTYNLYFPRIVTPSIFCLLVSFVTFLPPCILYALDDERPSLASLLA